MPRKRSANRDKAKEIYIQSNGKIRLSGIANKLKLSESTVRGWKAKDNWDDEINGAFQTKRKKIRSAPNGKNPIISSKNQENNDEKTKKGATKATKKTNSITPPPFDNCGNKNATGSGAPVGNQNAIGNQGGSGAPARNKFALKTGEFESILLNEIADEKECAIIKEDYNKYDLITEHIDIERLRAYRMLNRIKEVKNTPDSIAIEESLTRVLGKKLDAIALLHRMLTDDDNLKLKSIKLDIDSAKAESDINSNAADEIEGSNFIEALEGVTSEIWNDEPDD